MRARLEAFQVAAKGTDNLTHFILGAVKTLATVGEVCGALREVFGEYQERLVL